MPALVTILVVTLLTCLSGVGAFAILWPKDVSKPRPFRTWPITLVLMGLAAPAIIAVPIFTADFLSDNGLPWLELAFHAACLTSLALIAVALVGDRSRGRRRCPRCWYDMSATPVVEGGLTCSECGRAVPHERALFRSRRRLRVLLPAALLPALAALIPWNAIYYRGPDWANNLSNTALVLASPFAHQSLRLSVALERALPTGESPRDFSAWQRALLVQIARRAQADTTQARGALTACNVLIDFEADNRATVDALDALAAPALMYNRSAIELLGRIQAEPAAAKAVLLDRLAGADLGSAYLASIALVNVMPRAPGGPTPAPLLINGKFMTYSPELVAQLLRWFDPSDASRATLLSMSDTQRANSVAIVSLAQLWPEDAEIRAKLVDAVRFGPDAANDTDATRAVYSLLHDEMRTHKRRGGTSPRLSPLYTPELCDELEKWIPLLDRNDSAFTRRPDQKFGPLLRTVLQEARAAHAPTTP